MCRVPGQGQTLGFGRACRVRLLPLSLQTVLGFQVVAGPHPGRDADYLEIDQFHDRGTRGLVRPGQVIVADKDFAARGFKEFASTELEAALIRPGQRDGPPVRGSGWDPAVDRAGL